MDETKRKLVELLSLRPEELEELNTQTLFDILAKSIYTQDSMQIAFMARLGIDPNDSEIVGEVSAAFSVFAMASFLMHSSVQELCIRHPELVANSKDVSPMFQKLPELASNEKAYEVYNIGYTQLTFQELFEAVTDFEEKENVS